MQAIELIKGPNESPHVNHAANFEAVEAGKLKNRVKRRAEEHLEARPAQILRTSLQQVPSGILSQLPERTNLVKTIQRQRLKNMYLGSSQTPWQENNFSLMILSTM